jgi:hypothetical protein
MSATSNLENYIKNFRLTSPSISSTSSGCSSLSSASSDTGTVSSVDTDELLSANSSFSEYLRPSKVTKVKSISHLKKQKKHLKPLKPTHPAYMKPLRRTPLKMIDEEEDENFKPSYNIQDYLPTAKQSEGFYPKPPKSNFLDFSLKKNSSFLDRSKALTHFIDQISVDDDASSACSSVDTEALLQSSDEDEPVAAVTVKRSAGIQHPSVEIKKTPVTASFSHQFPSMDQKTFKASRLPPRCEYLEGTFKPKDLKNRSGSDSQGSRDSLSSAPLSSDRKEYIFTDRSDYADFEHLKDSFTNPMVSLTTDREFKVPRGPGSSTLHERQETGDFSAPPVSTSPEPGAQRLFPSSYKPEISRNQSERTRLQIDDDSSVRILSTEQTTRSEQHLDSPFKQKTRPRLVVSKEVDVCIPSTQRTSQLLVNRLFEHAGPTPLLLARDEPLGPRMKLTLCTCILKGFMENHLTSCRPVAVTAVLDRGSISSSKDYRSPALTTPCFSPKAPSVLEAVLTIQQGVRAWLMRRRAVRRLVKGPLLQADRRSPPMSLTAPRKFLDPSSSVSQGESVLTSLQYSQSLIAGSAEIDRATQSLYRALDQLRVLKQSSERSSESSFSLTESAISLEHGLPSKRPLASLGPDQLRRSSPSRDSVASGDSFDMSEGWVEGDSEVSSVDTEGLLASLNSSSI